MLYCISRTNLPEYNSLFIIFRFVGKPDFSTIKLVWKNIVFYLFLIKKSDLQR
jgi:hypothetical protein